MIPAAATPRPADGEPVGGYAPPPCLELFQSLQLHWTPPGRVLKSPAAWPGENVSVCPLPPPSAAASPHHPPGGGGGAGGGGQARARPLSDVWSARNARRCLGPQGRTGDPPPMRARHGNGNPNAVAPPRACSPGSASITARPRGAQPRPDSPRGSGDWRRSTREVCPCWLGHGHVATSCPSPGSLRRGPPIQPPVCKQTEGAILRRRRAGARPLQQWL